MEAKKHKPYIRWVLLAALLGLGLFMIPALVSGQEGEDTPETPVDHRFGAIESFWAAEEAAELGVGWERILFYWNEIQPTGPEDWNTLHVLEEWLVEAEARDRQVVGLLKNTPAWATDAEPFSGVPRGLYLPPDDPENLWANYVRRVVEYYAPRGVHHWIVWNEPEIKPGVYGHEFGGTLEDYFRLLQVAYLVAKETDPESTILLSGYSYWHDPQYLSDFFELAATTEGAAEHNHYFDLISLHIYFRVETVASLVEEVDDLQQSFGLDKPIWINETNAAPNLDPWWPVVRPQFQVDLDQQAWYVVQAHALGFGAGAERISVYKLVDILLPEGGESFGILRPDFTKRPAFLAYRTAIQQLRGFTGPVHTHEDDDYFIVTFTHPDRVTRILWARNDAAVGLQLPALAQEATVIDIYGRRETVTPAEGAYAIDLAGARCRDACDIGGPPIFVVENAAALQETPPAPDATPVLSTLTPTPEVTLTFTPWPTATLTPTSTPTATATATATPSPTATATSSPSPSPSATSAATATAQPPAAATAEPVPASAGSNTLGASPSSWWFFAAALLVAAALVGLFLFRRAG